MFGEQLRQRLYKFPGRLQAAVEQRNFERIFRVARYERRIGEDNVERFWRANYLMQRAFSYINQIAHTVTFGIFTGASYGLRGFIKADDMGAPEGGNDAKHAAAGKSVQYSCD